MVGDALADAQPEGGDFAAVGQVDAGGAVFAAAVQPVCGQRLDDGFFKKMHQFAHFQAAPGQVQEGVADELAGAVVGDLSATVDGNQGDVRVWREQVFAPPGLAEGVDRRVLQQPETTEYKILMDEENLTPADISEGYRWFKAKKMRYRVIPD